MSTSARLSLPLLAPGQAQKEITHNEALARLDILTHAVVQSVGLNTPPPSPEAGQCWIIGPFPEGDWAGKAQHLAGWTENGWRFVQPFTGLGVWDLDEGMFARWNGGVWVAGILTANAVKIGGVQIIGSRAPSISNPDGGGTVDVEARTAVESILSALRDHGLIEQPS